MYINVSRDVLAAGYELVREFMSGGKIGLLHQCDGDHHVCEHEEAQERFLS